MPTVQEMGTVPHMNRRAKVGRRRHECSRARRPRRLADPCRLQRLHLLLPQPRPTAPCAARTAGGP
jgi:hypothetical protein